MLRLSPSKPVLILLLFMAACQGIDNNQDSRSTAGKLNNQDSKSDGTVRFDADRSDTKSNKQRFSEFFRFQPGPDVKNLYCFAANPEVQSCYQLSFECSYATVQKIVQSLGLDKMESMLKPANLNRHEFSWWHAESIAGLHTGWNKIEEGLNQYLWYDDAAGKAYFFDTDE